MPLHAKRVKKRTKDLREALKKTQAELCEEFGLVPSAWSQWESEKYPDRLISFEVAQQLREAYGVSLDWLYYGDRLGSLPEDLAAELRRRGAA